MRLVKWVCLLFLLLLPAESCFGLAFPTAVGMGKETTGGRGGTVIKVTNLNDSGPGSFREALTKTLTPDNGRIIVFEVSGNIQLLSMLGVTKSNITIAGQTSPKGISVGNKTVYFMGDNYIIRHMRFRVGGQAYLEEGGFGGHSILFPGPGYGATNDRIIIDHCSFQWGVDETVAFAGGATNVTLQKNLISQGLVYAKLGAPSEHSKALMISNKRQSGAHHPITMTVYRNYISHTVDRIPMMYGEGAAEGVYVYLDMVNNVIFNWYHSALPDVAGDARVNWIGNYKKAGPNSYSGSTRPQSLSAEFLPTPAAPQIYMAGNVGTNRVPTDSEWDIGYYYYGGYDPLAYISTAYQKSSPWVMSRPVDAETMDYAKAQEIVADSGAYKLGTNNEKERDAVDAEIVAGFTENTSLYPATWMFLDNTTLDNYPPFENPAPPADTDGDGMPDSWESGKGLDPTTPNSSSYSLSETYTDIEVYVNELAGEGAVDPDPDPDPTVPVTASVTSGRYETTQTVTLTGSGTIRYCFGVGCTPSEVYVSPLKVLQNVAQETLRASNGGTSLLTLDYRKQRSSGGKVAATAYVPVPTTSSSACSVGQWSVDSTYHYLCKGTNSWGRITLGTW